MKLIAVSQDGVQINKSLNFITPIKCMRTHRDGFTPPPSLTKKLMYTHKDGASFSLTPKEKTDKNGYSYTQNQYFGTNICVTLLTVASINMHTNTHKYTHAYWQFC